MDVNQVLNTVEGWLPEGTYAYAEANSPYLALVGVVGLVLVVGFASHFLTKRSERERAATMKRRHRSAEIQRVLSDRIVQLMEDLIAEGKLSRHEVQMYSRDIGNLINIPDLVPRNKMALKARIKARLTNGHVNPAPIPGDPPPRGKDRFVFNLFGK